MAAYAWGVRRAGDSRVADMFDDAPFAWHEIDREGVIRRVNRAECELLGYEREELIGRPVVDLVACDEQSAAHAAIRRKFEETRPLEPLICDYIRRDGEPVRVCIHESAVRDRYGRIVALSSALVDFERVLRLDKTVRESEMRHRRLLETAGATDDANEAERQDEPVASGLRMLGREEEEEAKAALAEATPGAPALPR